MTWKRIRGVLVDFVLIGAAVSYAQDLVSAWLMAHERTLCVALGVLHIVMLPMLALERWFHNPAPTHQRTPVERVFVWSMTLYYGVGFIVPAVVAMTLDSPSSEAFFMATVFGPLVLAGLVIVFMLAIDKPTNYRFSRVGAKPPRGFTTVFIVLCSSYLLCMEAVLMVAARGTEFFSGMGTLIAALIGYVPIRLVIALANDAPPVEIATLVIGIVHFLFRLATARVD